MYLWRKQIEKRIAVVVSAMLTYSKNENIIEYVIINPF